MEDWGLGEVAVTVKAVRAAIRVISSTVIRVTSSTAIKTTGSIAVKIANKINRAANSRVNIYVLGNIIAELILAVLG